MEQVSSLIIEKLREMAEAEDPTELCTKFKAVITLLPYAILKERDGEPEMLDAFLRAARVPGVMGFVWRYAEALTRTTLHNATPRAIVLVSPLFPWYWLTVGDGSIQLWVAAATAVQYTEEVAQCVVDTLMQIASVEEVLRHITVDVWSWLTKRPSFPPNWSGHFYGSYPHIFKAIRELRDIEILKSYFLLVWSEWEALQNDAFDEMCTSLQEDFGTVGMGHHRFYLVQRLDRILGRLDQGPEYLQWDNRYLSEDDFQKAIDQYGKLKDILQETNIDTICCTSYPVTVIFHILTQEDIHSVSRTVYVCASSATSVDSPPYPNFDAHIRFPHRAHETGSLPPCASTGEYHEPLFAVFSHCNCVAFSIAIRLVCTLVAE